MNEKQFIITKDSNGLKSIYDTKNKKHEPLLYYQIQRKGTFLVKGFEDVVSIMNELAEENERLHNTVKEFKEKYDAQLYLFGQLNSDFHWLREDKRDLEKENEQLKKELDNFIPVIFQDILRKGTVILYSKGGTDEWGK